MSKKQVVNTKENLELLRKTVKNFNARVDYYAKKGFDGKNVVLPDKVHLREKITYTEDGEERTKVQKLIDSFANKREFNSYIAKLNRFNAETVQPVKASKTSPDYTTKWQKGEYNRQKKKKEKERQKILDKEVKIAGEGTGQTRAGMGQVEDKQNFAPIPKPDDLTPQELKDFDKNLAKRNSELYKKAKQQLMKDNYLKGISNNGIKAGIEAYGIDFDELMDELSPQEFYELTQTDEAAAFNFYKDPQEYDVLVRKIAGAFVGAVRDKYKDTDKEKPDFLIEAEQITKNWNEIL